MAEFGDQFDETAYLRLYPDVAKAISEGRERSAWSHYDRHGRKEGRLANATSLMTRMTPINFSPPMEVSSIDECKFYHTFNWPDGSTTKAPWDHRGLRRRVSGWHRVCIIIRTGDRTREWLSDCRNGETWCSGDLHR